MGSLTEAPTCASFRAGRRARSCTNLLYDPRATLSKRAQWPDHLCYSDFMRRSIEVWVSQVVGQAAPTTKLWAETYPLPIGDAAARRLYARSGQRYPDELAGILPFRGGELAYWGLRVEESRSVLDLFGFQGWSPPDADAQEYLWFGSLAYSLRGRDDTSLMRLAEHAATWWRDFSLQRVRGRPRGSGTWESGELLEAKLREAVAAERSAGRTPTQEKVAPLLYTSTRQLRAWISDNKIDWKKIKG